MSDIPWVEKAHEINKLGSFDGKIGATKHECRSGVGSTLRLDTEGWTSMPSQDTPTPDDSAIPYGYCHCGCGQKTNIARQSRAEHGWTIREPVRFVFAHHQRLERRPFVYEINDGVVAFVAYGLHGETARVLVDEADLEHVQQHTWKIANAGRVTTYVKRIQYSPESQRNRSVLLHVDLMGELPAGRFVDHINGDGFDNRRCNLRVATKGQNGANRVIGRNNTSGYKGVWFHAKENRWIAKLARQHVGTFVDLEDAARAYDEAARREYGEFACLNFPRPGERSAITGEVQE